MSNTT